MTVEEQIELLANVVNTINNDRFSNDITMRRVSRRLETSCLDRSEVWLVSANVREGILVASEPTLARALKELLREIVHRITNLKESEMQSEERSRKLVGTYDMILTKIQDAQCTPSSSQS